MYDQITTSEFLQLLESMRKDQKKNILDWGLEEGWLEEQDRIHLYKPLERRDCARIIHQYLLVVCHETDEDDWNCARKFLDLFDCRTCVGHVAQVYVKGIMTSVSDSVFGMRQPVSKEEALQIVLLTINSKLRKQPKMKQTASLQLRISYEDAMAQLQLNHSCALIDVRLQDEYEESHLPGARNLPLRSILDGTALSLINQNQPLLFYCDFGVQSDFAAGYLVDAGFINVHSFRIK